MGKSGYFRIHFYDSNILRVSVILGKDLRKIKETRKIL